MENKQLTEDHMIDINNINKAATIGIFASEIKLIKIMHDITRSLYSTCGYNTQVIGVLSIPVQN